MNNTLVHYGHTQIEEINLLQKLANELGLSFIHDGIQAVSSRNPQFPIASFWDFINHAKYANMIAIWNGMQCYGPLITKICQNMNIPKFYMEWGLLPQSENFLIDPTGFCADSILNRDLSWITLQDMDFLYKQRIELTKKYSISEENYILIPLQIENDSQVLYYTKYRNMYDFVHYISQKFYDKRIIVKIHPKNNIDRHMTCWHSQDILKFDPKRVSFIDNKDIDFLSIAAKASLVVGLTSTALYEAAILGKPIKCFGEHPLKNQSDNIDKVCAGVLALNINRKTGNIKNILDRFN